MQQNVRIQSITKQQQQTKFPIGKAKIIWIKRKVRSVKSGGTI